MSSTEYLEIVCRDITKYYFACCVLFLKMVINQKNGKEKLSLLSHAKGSHAQE